MTSSEASSGVQPRSPKGRPKAEGLTPENAERPSLAPPKTTFSGDASPARGLLTASAFKAVCCPACNAVFALATASGATSVRKSRASDAEPEPPLLTLMGTSPAGSGEPVPEGA